MHAHGNLDEVRRDQVPDKDPSFRKARPEFVFNQRGSTVGTFFEPARVVSPGLRQAKIT